MRITRDLLLKLAKDIVEKRFTPDKNVTAVFLVGSVRDENVVINGPIDIDLLIIYNGQPVSEREFVKLSNEVHLDISYEPASRYSQPRELRGDPWRGWMMWDPLPLHQKGKFFEYTQAIIRSQFEDAANLIKRARTFSIPAREAWNEMALDADSASPQKILTAAANAANALAVLTGAPIPERRLLADFPTRAQALDLEEMVTKLFSVFGDNINPSALREWIPAWEQAFTIAAQSAIDPAIAPVRLAYYKAAIESQLDSNMPAAALWPLFHTWALCVETMSLPAEHISAWQTVCAEIGMSPVSMPDRVEALDAYLDMLEEVLEQLGIESGL